MKKSSLTELGKTRMSKDICACMATRKAARSITQFYNQYLSESGVGTSQHSILMIAYLAQAITITKMANIAVMDRTTLTRNMKQLVKEGLIEINPGEDRREKVITITRQGIKLLKKIIPMWERAQIEFEKRFGSKKFDNLINKLNEVVSITQ